MLSFGVLLVLDFLQFVIVPQGGKIVELKTLLIFDSFCICDRSARE